MSLKITYNPQHWLWTLAACMALLNVAFQGIQPHPIGNLQDWDVHQITSMTQRVMDDKFLGINIFSTYGPLFRYLNSTAFGGDYLVRYSTQVIFLFSQIAIAFIFLRRCIWKYASLLAFFMLMVFNFPVFGGVPFMLILWGWTWRGGKRDLPYFFLGWLTTWIWLFYKPGAGMMGLTTFFITIAMSPFGGSVLSRFRLALFSLFAFILASLLLHLAYGGGIESLWRFFFISLEDMRNYAHHNGLPLQTGRLLRARISETPIFLRSWITDDIFIICLWGLPLWLFINVIHWAFQPFVGKRYWLACIAAPILFGEYKHSFVRADISNIYGIFFGSGALTVALALFVWHEVHWRKTIGYFILPLILLDLVGLTPYNIPWRHRREFFATSPWNYLKNSLEYEKTSQHQIEQNLKSLLWLKTKSLEELASIPGALLNANLAHRNFIFPTHQDYYVMSGGQREKLLKDELTLTRGPKWILWESQTLDQKLPFSNAPEAYMEMLANYDLDDHLGENYLLKKRAQSKKISLIHTRLIAGTEKDLSTAITIKQGEVLRIQGQSESHWYAPIANLLLRGDVYNFDISFAEEVMTVQISQLLLTKGFLLVPPLEDFYSEIPREINLKIHLKGHLCESYPYDLSQLFYKSNSLLNLSLESFEIHP